jgi:hypothetical protein
MPPLTCAFMAAPDATNVLVSCLCPACLAWLGLAWPGLAGGGSGRNNSADDGR